MNWKPLWVSLGIFLILLTGLIFLVKWADSQPDNWCSTSHPAVTSPPTSLKTATDYFNQGNYDYDIGNCSRAIADYSGAIQLDSKYPQALNNRAYTYMRIKDYKDALTDLNKAIIINPNYVQALMNRGDIHNYYYQIDKQAAIADYEKVISINGGAGTSVCGHLFLAKHNGWNFGTIWDMLSGGFRTCI